YQSGLSGARRSAPPRGRGWPDARPAQDVSRGADRPAGSPQAPAIEGVSRAAVRAVPESKLKSERRLGGSYRGGAEVKGGGRRMLPHPCPFCSLAGSERVFYEDSLV